MKKSYMVVFSHSKAWLFIWMGLQNMEENRTISISQYYGSLPNMKSKFDRFARKDFFQGQTREEWEKWAQDSRKTLADLLGLDKMDHVPLMSRLVETVTAEPGIKREKVLIQTEENVWVPMYILIPENIDRPKVFITPPGHQGAGKFSVAGVREIPAVADAILKYNYDYGMQLARLGFVAVCPDCRGFGERRDEALQHDDEKSFLTSSCFHLAHMAEPLGETVIGMCVWDLMKIMDYVLSRTEWDTSQVSCLGFSGGGMQTLYFSALDERVHNVFISGYLYGFKDSLLILNGNCSCNYVPHLWEHFDMGDIASLIAPRNLMVQSCRADHLNGPRGLDNVYEQIDIIKAAYRLYDAEDRIIHDIEEGEHCWHDTHLKEYIDTFGIK